MYGMVSSLRALSNYILTQLDRYFHVIASCDKCRRRTYQESCSLLPVPKHVVALTPVVWMSIGRQRKAISSLHDSCDKYDGYNEVSETNGLLVGKLSIVSDTRLEKFVDHLPD